MDAYTRIIKRTDPLQTALVFNCGMGAVRTTFAMVAACLVRRKQLIDQGIEDPFITRPGGHKSGISTVRFAKFQIDHHSNYIHSLQAVWLVRPLDVYAFLD